jgi:hypothetical protein
MEQKIMEIKCINCEKKYIRKSSLEKHKILCDFISKTEREKIIDNQENEDLPTFIQLVKIVQELSLKNSKMENKIIQMEKWIDNKKKKINVIDWLKTNKQPLMTFGQWINNILITNENIEYLKENTIFQTIQSIFISVNEISVNEISVNESNINKVIIPIACFCQKANLFYIYDNNWRQMKTDDFINLLQKIQHKFIKALTHWHQQNIIEITNNDSMSILYNKMIIKIMNISLVQDANYGKIHANLYNYLKMDLKNLIEYEFEF